MGYSKRAARPKNSRDHGKMVGRRRNAPDRARVVPKRPKHRRDHLVPLRKKHPRRRVDKTDGRRNGQGSRTRKIRSLWQRIVELTFGSIEAVPHEYSEKLHEILEDVL